MGMRPAIDRAVGVTLNPLQTNDDVAAAITSTAP